MHLNIQRSSIEYKKSASDLFQMFPFYDLQIHAPPHIILLHNDNKVTLVATGARQPKHHLESKATLPRNQVHAI